MSVEKLKVNILGLGRIGLRHATIVKENDAFEIESIIDIDESKKKYAAQFEVPFYNDIKKLSSNQTPSSLLAICTPNGLHSQHCKIAIQKNYHVICEKPFGLISLNCEETIALSEKNQKQIFCVMQNRYSPPSKWLKSIISEKRLGSIYQVVVNCFWNRNIDYFENSNWKGSKSLDGGVLFTQFSHFVDTLYWLFGNVKVISAKKFKQNKNLEIEISDAGYFAFETEENAFGTFNYSINHAPNNLESSILIIGERGSVKVGGQYMEKVEFCNIPNYSMPELDAVNPPNNYGDYKGSASNHSILYKNIYNFFTNQPFQLTFANEGRDVVAIIEKALK